MAFYIEKILDKTEEKILKIILNRLGIKLDHITDHAMTIIFKKFHINIFSFDDILGEKIPNYNNKKCLYKGEKCSTIDLIKKKFSLNEANILFKIMGL